MYEGDFCPKCGQKASTARFRVNDMLISVVTSLLCGDNKLLVTCKGLLTRPGHTVREYLLGKRASYFAPVSLLLFLVAAYAIVTYVVADAVSPFDVLRLQLNKDDVTTDSAKQFVVFYQALTENRVYFSLFAVLLNLLPYRFVFRKCGVVRPDGSVASLNLAEHFFTLLYQTCFNMLLAFAVLPFSAIAGSEVWTVRLCMVMPTIYCIVLYKQICSIGWIKSIVLNLLCIVGSMLMSLVFLLLAFGVSYGYDYAK